MHFNLNESDVEDLCPLDAPLFEAIVELKSASDAYQSMVDVGLRSFYKYDRAWRDFLQSIDRAWNKTSARCKGEKHWQKMKSKYETLRKNDPLLKHLVQARNVTEHSISPVVKEWDAGLKATPSQGKIKLTWQKWDRPLLPVTNRGTTFNPPKKHLNKPMTYYRSRRPGIEEPRVVAELAMCFYVEMINDISHVVFPTP